MLGKLNLAMLFVPSLMMVTNIGSEAETTCNVDGSTPGERVSTTDTFLAVSLPIFSNLTVYVSLVHGNM